MALTSKGMFKIDTSCLSPMNIEGIGRRQRELRSTMFAYQEGALIIAWKTASSRTTCSLTA